MSEMVNDLHVVIMAGGIGSRFWPLSRRALPKQFLALGGEQSLLRETFLRCVSLTTPERVWVVAGASHTDLVRRELPELPAANVIGEPVGRNTAPCIALAAQRIARIAADATILVCPADHVIRPLSGFQRTVRAAVARLAELETDEEPWTFTIGVTPTRPATGFGYIERATELDGADAEAEAVAVAGEPDPPAFSVRSFKEKPTGDVAEGYLARGGFYWNSGIFLWRARGVLALVDEHLPELGRGVAAIGREAEAGGDLQRVLGERFAALPSISIDYGVLEKTPRVGVVEAAFDWDDVGSWEAAARYGKTDGDGNSARGEHLAIDTRDSIVVAGDRLVATVGLDRVVVVETADAVLVCHRDHVERVREVVERLGKIGREDLR